MKFFKYKNLFTNIEKQMAGSLQYMSLKLKDTLTSLLHC